MKIHPVSAIYVISLPFKCNSDRSKLFHLLMEGRIIVSGITKSELSFIKLCTTNADNIYAPKTVRVQVNSRYLSLEQLQKLMKKVLFEVQVMFHESNISNTKKILQKFQNYVV